MYMYIYILLTYSMGSPRRRLAAFAARRSRNSSKTACCTRIRLPA